MINMEIQDARTKDTTKRATEVGEKIEKKEEAYKFNAYSIRKL